MQTENPSEINNIEVNGATLETGNTESFNPMFQESVIERSYTGPNIAASDIPNVIEEPTFSPPPYQEIVPEQDQVNSEKTFNPEYTELDDKSKKQGAEMMADAILDGYSTATNMLGNVATISNSKLETEIAEGTIDPNLQLPIDEHTTLSVKEFVTNYNESAAEAFSVTDEFKETVKPPLVRVLMKRGAAMTDEQFLIYHFSKDLLFKGVSAFQLRSQNNQILNMLRESTAKQNVQEIQPQTYTPPVVEQEPVADPTPVVRETKQSKPSRKRVDYEAEVFSTETLPSDGFKEGYKAPPGTPEFGDMALLAHMEEASKIGKPANQTKMPTNRKTTPRTKKQ